jgi:heme/copper-type cytochrome/quinol oxidase subunit 3
VKSHITADVSGLPTYGFGHITTMWWGTLGFIASEGMVFVLAAAMYLYYAVHAREWPIAAPPPNHWPGTSVLIILLLSCIPNAVVDKAARRQDLKTVQWLMVLMSIIGLIVIGIRFYEFRTSLVSWDSNAYGSIVWLILGLHATHLITDSADTIVLATLMFTRHAHGKRFSDVSDNAFYWYFVVGAWVPLYLLVYWFPRWQ